MCCVIKANTDKYWQNNFTITGIFFHETASPPCVWTWRSSQPKVWKCKNTWRVELFNSCRHVLIYDKRGSFRDIGSISPASLVRSQWWLIIHQWGLVLKTTPNWVMAWHYGCFLSDTLLRSLFNTPEVIYPVVSLVHMFTCARSSFLIPLCLYLSLSLMLKSQPVKFALKKNSTGHSANSFSCRIWNSLPRML